MQFDFVRTEWWRLSHWMWRFMQLQFPSLVTGYIQNGPHDLLSWQKQLILSTFSGKYSVPISMFRWIMTQWKFWRKLSCKFPYFRKYSEITNISWPKVAFLQFCYYIFQITGSTSKISARIVDFAFIHWNIKYRNWIFQKSTKFWCFLSRQQVMGSVWM